MPGPATIPPTSTSTPRRFSIQTPLVLLSLFLVVISLILVVGRIWWYIHGFTSTAGVSGGQLVSSVKIGLKDSLPQYQGQTNFLILGLDSLPGERQNSLLTDTMIIASINKDAEVRLLPLPRDIWINPLKTKINSLYYYGEQDREGGGPQYTQDVIEGLTSLPIHFNLTVELTTLKDAIDTLGYITVNVEQGFVDTKFPRSDVPQDILPESLRYKTVEFTSGLQQLNGERTLEYIRSRQSTSEETGTDLNRSKRQQQVIQALVKRLQTKEIITNPIALGKLYKIWHNQVKTNLTDNNIISLAKILINKPLAIKTLTIPIDEPGKPGILLHPTETKYNQWVFEPHDPSWVQLQTWIKDNLINSPKTDNAVK